MVDPRAGLAEYYDLNPAFPDDVPFYLGRTRAGDRVLELGCGTGRVSVPLARACAFLHGVDHSDAMLAWCRARLEEAGVDASRWRLDRADIADLHLGARFDLVVAPFRVLQNLEADEAVEGLLDGVRRHLAPGGRCILNAFCPNRSPAELVDLWSGPPTEMERWSTRTADGRVECVEGRGGVRASPLVIRPTLTYRRYRGDDLVDEAVHSFAMRCWYPDELLDLLGSHGFRVAERWGGYAGEAYGEGRELVVEVSLPASEQAP